MFGRRYWGGRMFGPTYWGDGGDGTPVVTGQRPRATRFRSGQRTNWRHRVQAALLMVGGWL